MARSPAITAVVLDLVLSIVGGALIVVAVKAYDPARAELCERIARQVTEDEAAVADYAATGCPTDLVL